MKYVVIFLLWTFTGFEIHAQSKAGKSSVADTSTADYSFHKKIPESIRKVAIETLSNYPELRETYIEFIFDPDIFNVFMQARPVFFSLLKPRKKRIYQIQIMPYMLVEDKKVPVSELPQDALKGWFAHELGHILDYQSRSSIELIFFGFQYLLFEDFVIEAERRADIFAIQHGLGNEIAATKNYILNKSTLPETYKNKIKSLYMSPQEVLSFLKEQEENNKEEDQESIHDELEESDPN